MVKISKELAMQFIGLAEELLEAWPSEEDATDEATRMDYAMDRFSVQQKIEQMKASIREGE